MTNDLSKLKKSELKKYWFNHIKLWSEGKVTQSEYCRKNNINRDRFAAWKKRCEEEVTSKETGLVELSLSEFQVSSYLDVIVSNNLGIRVKEDFNPELLIKIINTLENCK